MTEVTASTERFDRATVERSPAAGERTLSASVLSDKDFADRLTTMARSERTGSGPIISGETFIIPLPPGLPEISAPSLKFMPKVSDSGLRAISISDRPVELTGPLGDKRLLYSTADSSGRGVNQIEVDRLGIVRSFAFKDENGLRRTIAGERLTRLMAGAEVNGWTSARTGSGTEATTIVTAPDGRTTFKVDPLGRLISDVGSNQITPARGVQRFSTTDGTRYESAGIAGEIRSASVGINGDFRSLTIRNGSEDRQLTPSDWAQLRPGGSASLGGLWHAVRGNFGGSLPGDSIRLAHPDGTAYYISPEGRLLHHNGPKESYRTPLGTLGDTVTRHTSPDRSHRGMNIVDIDDSGVVRSLRSTDNAGRTFSLPMSTLSSLPADGVAVMHKDWKVSRTGSGDLTLTTVVAPDRKTTYLLDLKGRLIPGQRK